MATASATPRPRIRCLGRTLGSASCRWPAVSYRSEVLDDPSFDPGRRLALVPEPDNPHDRNAIAIYNDERTLQLGYVPASVAPDLDGDEQAVSLWRVDGGLRVLVVPADSWIGSPR